MKTLKIFSFLVLFFTKSFAQDASKKDQNDVNTKKPTSGIMADSPITFPKEGPLPAKYIEDIVVENLEVEKDYFLFSSPSRSISQINRIQKEMPEGNFIMPIPDWKFLLQFKNRLTNGGEITILGLGDSIVNDTMRSAWVSKLQEAYPKAKIKALVYVRGGGGCQHYIEENRIDKYLVPLQPNFIFIGGISQKNIESVSKAIDMIREKLPNAEFLLASGAFGTVDPRDETALKSARYSATSKYGVALKKLAKTKKCAFLDMTSPWAEYIRTSRLHPHLFYRDEVHANEFGEQILSKILHAFFSKL